MKTVKYIFYIVFFFFMICCVISCKETVREELQILIKNRTNDSIHITLYPTKGSKRNFSIPQNPDNIEDHGWNEVLCSSNDLNINPYTLTTNMFDSIHITLKNSVTIKFTHETVVGYSENIFAENSTWEFRIEEWNKHTQLRSYPVRYYKHKFPIFKDRIIIE